MEPIINRVAESEIEVYNLDALWDGKPVVEFDVVSFLVEGLILREKAFREHVKGHDWSQYTDRHVAVFCSTDDRLAVSTGSACTSGSGKPSHVLKAMGLPNEDALASIRFSLGRFTTDDEIDYAIEHVLNAVERLREGATVASS